ncbi:MAG: TIGR02253 family HAD-type hydrolase [Planctomycetota bacterium]
MALKAVFFDIDDTLFSTTQFARIARWNAVKAMCRAGLDMPPEEVLRELEEVIAEFSSNYDQHFDQLLRRLAPQSKGRVNPALIVAAGVVAYHDTKFRELAPFPDVLPLLEVLSSAGVKCGVITHGLRIKQAEKLIRLGVLPYLDPMAIYISDQIGISKPNPKLYGYALQDQQLIPREVLYVGDNPAHDILPPQSLGMRTVWARRASKFKLEDINARPTHIVDDFEQLRDILQLEYGVGEGPLRRTS